MHKKPHQLHTLIVLMENKTGVLNRVTSMIRRRKFNIESLSVGHTEKEGVSRMTIVVDGTNTNIEQVIKQMYKIISVLKIYDVTNESIIESELSIIKVHATKSTRIEIQQIAQMFDARIVDIAIDSLILQIVAEPKQVDNFIDLLRSFGVKEMVRTGSTAMIRGPEDKLNLGN